MIYDKILIRHWKNQKYSDQNNLYVNLQDKMNGCQDSKKRMSYVCAPVVAQGLPEAD